MKRFEGIFTVLPTLYLENGDIDFQAMAELTRSQIEAGVHGLVVLGSYGECPYLTPKHQREAVAVVLETNARTLPVIVGINERGTEPALQMARWAEKMGAHGLLVALPIFYPLDEGSVFGHYQTLCQESGLPVLFYNFPSHTHLQFTPAQISNLASIPGLIGAKETIFKTREVQELVEAVGEDFCVFTGMCFNLTKTMAVGACGAICPIPNVVPGTAVRLYQALRAGDQTLAAALQEEINRLIPLLGGAQAPQALIKEALRLLGHSLQVTVKPPLPQLTSDQARLVKKTLFEAGLLKE